MGTLKMDFLNPQKKIENKADKYKQCKITPKDLLTVLTSIKGIDKILDNGGFFYGLYKKNKKWFNLVDIGFDIEKIDESKWDKIIYTKVTGNELYSLGNYMSRHEALLPTASLISSWIINLDNKAILRVIENMLPKKTFYVKSKLGDKPQQLEIINKIKEYFNVNQHEAESYLKFIIDQGAEEEFVAMFEEGGAVKKEKTK